MRPPAGSSSKSRRGAPGSSPAAVTHTGRTASTCVTIAHRWGSHSATWRKSRRSKSVPATRFTCARALRVKAAVIPAASLYAATTSASVLPPAPGTAPAPGAAGWADGGVSTPTRRRSSGPMCAATMAISSWGSRALPRLDPSSMKHLRPGSSAAAARPSSLLPTCARTSTPAAAEPRRARRWALPSRADSDTSMGTYVVLRRAAEAITSGATFCPLPAEHSTMTAGGRRAAAAGSSGKRTRSRTWSRSRRSSVRVR
mmetsp:Transcript_4519/g.15013  ORF Transcript_4519/g.15013 Transcript_4519/m.15013 type:complete len:257 (+) Transcript_4519:375-1145(+)